MKKIIIIAMMLSLCLISTVLAVTPVRFFKFDETSGTTALDSSPSEVNGTYDTELNISVNGVTGKAIYFSTSIPNDKGIYFPMTGLNWNDDSDLSISFWEKYQTANGGNSALTIIPIPLTDTNRFSIPNFDNCFSCDPNGLRFSLNEYYGSTNWDYVNYILPEPLQWNYITLTYAGTTDRHLDIACYLR
jgi:hypothetical protein